VRLHLKLAVALLLGGPGCSSEPPPAPVEGLCTPGENIFCRCPGGDAGTKRCNDAGDGFNECEPCRPRDGVGGGSDVGPSASSSGAGGGESGRELLRPCLEGSECLSGTCENNYCTIECEKVSDCPFPVSECVPWAGGTICMPVCTTATDCELYGAPPSVCGYSPAIDNWSVTVCANWGGDHDLLPAGTDCPPLDHETCNLGYLGRANVCTPEGVCDEGCFSEGDCGADEDCSSQGDDLGECR
jgi:hypothetical protein